MEPPKPNVQGIPASLSHDYYSTLYGRLSSHFSKFSYIKRGNDSKKKSQELLI